MNNYFLDCCILLERWHFYRNGQSRNIAEKGWTNDRKNDRNDCKNDRNDRKNDRKNDCNDRKNDCNDRKSDLYGGVI